MAAIVVVLLAWKGRPASEIWGRPMGWMEGWVVNHMLRIRRCCGLLCGSVMVFERSIVERVN
jgi:hypothetical protein